MGDESPHNPPSVWVTINPADTQDPIAQVLARIGHYTVPKHSIPGTHTVYRITR